MFAWQGGIARVAERVSSSSLRKTNGATPVSKSITIADGQSVEWGYPTGVDYQTTRNALRGLNGFGNFWNK